MATNFLSDNVRVFPSAYRITKAEGKYNSEENFTNIINSIVDVDSYVISLSSNNTLKIVIHGYYFEILNFTISSNEYRNCWVAIRVEKGNDALVNYTNGSINELDSNSNYFEGLKVGTSESDLGIPQSSTDYAYYKLHVSENGSLLNQVKFSSTSIYYKGDTGTTLSSKIDTKQDKLTAGNGIDSSKLNNNTVELIPGYVTSLESMKSAKGSNTNPVYINSSGQVTPIGGSSGTPQVNVPNKTNCKYTQAALISGGQLSESGVRFYTSTFSPSDAGASDIGSNGDFWFKYS